MLNWNAIVFYIALVLGGVSYALGMAVPEASRAARLWTAAFAGAMLLAVVTYDVEEFVRGAAATLSQDGLRLQTRTRVFSFLCLLAAATLAMHITVPRLPSGAYDWRGIFAWAFLFQFAVPIGSLLGGTVLSQLSFTQD